MAVLLAVFPGVSIMAVRAHASTTERVVTDYYTGLAIEGFDPVAYFVAGAARRGLPQWELRFEGTNWRFANEGNKAQFAAAPEVYAPRFGGYDPVDLAEGRAVAGSPTLWAIHDERLYLFSSEANRLAFASRPGATSAKAERAWPEIARQLSR